MTLKPLRFIVPAAFLGAVALSIPAFAGGSFWDPPGEDPCDNPMINCLGGGALDQDNWAGAASMIGEELERQAEEDPVKGFIFWFAETFGPNIPTDPGDDGGDDGGDGGDDGGKSDGGNTNGGGDGGSADSGGSAPPKGGGSTSDKPEESSYVSQLPDAKYTKLMVDSTRFVDNVRTTLDKVPEGGTLKVDGVKYKVIYKREAKRKKRREFTAVLVPKRKYDKGKRTNGITLRAKGGKLYVSGLKRRKR